MSMTDNELRIAIAEACGWRLEWQGIFAKDDDSREILHLLRPDGEIEIAGYHPRNSYDALRLAIARYVPDYLNDLNAMAEALAILTPDQRNQFLRELQIVVDDNIHGGWFWACVNATARQRALAFFQTIAAPPQVPEGGQEGK